MKSQHILLLFVCGVVLGVLILAGVNLRESRVFGGEDKTTHTNPQLFEDTVNASSTVQVSGAATFYSTLATHALVTFNTGSVHSYVNSTSTTATTYTLIAADIVDYESVIITPNTGDTTFTFPASSTLSAFVAAAGDWAEQCWYNATTTAGIDITIAAGTGIDWEISSSTDQVVGTPPKIGPGESACFKYFRQPATATTFDISLLMTAYVNAD